MENCGLSVADFYRALLQMQQTGRFSYASVILFERTSVCLEVVRFPALNALQRLAEVTGLPIIFNADIGHVPPQLPFINGTYAHLNVANGKGVMKMCLQR